MRAVLAIVSLVLLPKFGILFGLLCVRIWDDQPVFIALGVGFVAGLVLYRLWLRRLRGFGTFEHELTHAVMALLFFRPIKRFVVRPGEGGWVRHGSGFGGELGDDFISLAPYILPTFTAAAVMVRPLLEPSWFPWFDGFIGITLGYHTWSTVLEVKRNFSHRTVKLAGTTKGSHTDLGHLGLVVSAITIPSLTLALHGLLFAVILDDYGGFKTWWHMLWA